MPLQYTALDVAVNAITKAWTKAMGIENNFKRMEATMTTPQDVAVKMLEARSKYSAWDKVRAAICRDLIEREVGLTIVQVRSSIGLGWIAPSQGKDQTAKDINAWVTATWTKPIETAWAYLKSISISFD